MPSRLAQRLGCIRHATKDREQENELEHHQNWREWDKGSRMKKLEKQENKVHVEKTGGKLDKRMKTSHRAGSFRGGWIKEHTRTQNRRRTRKEGCGIPTEAHAIMGWWLSQFYFCLLLLESPGLLVIGRNQRTWDSSEDISISCSRGLM